MKVATLLLALMGSGTYDVTAYSWGCGATNLTKSETWPVPLFTVAADPEVLPLGTLIRIDGAFLRGRVFRVEDTGKSIKGRTIDIMVSNCMHASWWGRKPLRVEVVGHATIPKRRKSR